MPCCGEEGELCLHLEGPRHMFSMATKMAIISAHASKPPRHVDMRDFLKQVVREAGGGVRQCYCTVSRGGCVATARVPRFVQS